MTSIADALRGPLSASANVPLRVAAYTKISDAIRKGVIGPGMLLPSEPELVEYLQVSRTVVREALIFLEEDGLIRSRRGIGRFVSEELPVSGIEQIQPAEVMLAAGSATSVRQTVVALQEGPSPFVAEVMDLPGSAGSWFIESIVFRDDTVIGLVQEHLPDFDLLTQDLAPISAILRNPPADRTILAAILESGLRPGLGTTEISVGAAGASRSRLLGVASNDPVLVLTRHMQFAGRLVYVSKILINHHETQISVSHTAM